MDPLNRSHKVVGHLQPFQQKVIKDILVATAATFSSLIDSKTEIISESHRTNSGNYSSCFEKKSKFGQRLTQRSQVSNSPPKDGQILPEVPILFADSCSPFEYHHTSFRNFYHVGSMKKGKDIVLHDVTCKLGASLIYQTA